MAGGWGGGEDAQISTDDTKGVPGTWETDSKRQSRRGPQDRTEKSFYVTLGNVGCIL